LFDRDNHPNDRIVSDESERLILVDLQDRPCGYASKAECHDGEGVLHRAFSLFVVNPAGQILMQQRGAQKRLWPLRWSNSCCSHPREGEAMEVATRRRLEEELGIRCELGFLYKFRYQATFGDTGAEHEFCWVYVGRTDEAVRCNRNEIAAWMYVEPARLDHMLTEHPEWFTPWFRMEWQCIIDRHWDRFSALGQPPVRRPVTAMRVSP